MTTIQQAINETVNYDFETGRFEYKADIINKRKGQFAGYHRNGGIVININGIIFPAEILAWYFIHGKLSGEKIIHLNHDKYDNSAKNLGLESWVNRFKSYWYLNKQYNKWEALVIIDKKENVSVGFFDDPMEAKYASDAKVKEFQTSSDLKEICIKNNYSINRQTKEALCI